jgi:hypothetical protein
MLQMDRQESTQNFSEDLFLESIHMEDQNTDQDIDETA